MNGSNVEFTSVTPKKYLHFLHNVKAVIIIDIWISLFLILTVFHKFAKIISHSINNVIKKLNESEEHCFYFARHTHIPNFNKTSLFFWFVAVQI